MSLSSRCWHRARVGLVVVVTLLGWASLLDAQERKGFFFGVGLGYGSFTESCYGCGGDAIGALSGYWRLGGTISERFLLGVESTGWYKDYGYEFVTMGTFTANAYFYPMAGKGLFVKGGAGLANVLGTESLGVGFGWQLGAGYDLRVGQKTAVTPTLTFFNGEFSGASEHVIQVALAYSIY